MGQLELMDDRTMPTATFRCTESLDQTAVLLTYLRREDGRVDHLKPVPRCPRPDCPLFDRPMELIQIEYV